MSPLLRVLVSLPRAAVDRPPVRRKQDGMSLVGLMVGLLLSMITVVATLYAYKNVVASSLSSSANSRSQNVNASLVLQLARLLPQAGWGLGGSAVPPGATVNSDLVLLSVATVQGATLSGTAVVISTALQSGNAVVWASAVSATTQCSALLAGADGAMTLMGPVACTSAADWSSLPWTAQITLAAPGALKASSFSVQKVPCWPYSSIAGGQSAARVSLISASSVVTRVCLTNLVN